MLPYSNQLRAIREMLDNPAEGSDPEGYDLLFKLWLENRELTEFSQELLQDAIKYPLLVIELRTRLRELRLKSSITGTYLRDKFEAFATDVENYKAQLSKEAESLVSEIPDHKPDISKDDKKSKVGIPETGSTENPETRSSSFKIWASTLIKVLNKPRIVISSLIAIIIIIWVFYLIPKNGPVTWTISSGVTASYTYPKYLSVQDQNTINVPIVNSDDTAFDGTITLIFEDPGVMAMPVAGQSLSLDLAVPPHGRKTMQFNFSLAEKPPKGKIEFYFQISNPNGIPYKSNEESFLVSPIPYLRSTSAWLFGSAGLGALLIAVLWERLQKSLGLK